MTVWQTLPNQGITKVGRHGAQTAERPRMGASCLTFGSSLFGKRCETRSWQAMVSHKTPGGATGRFVPMTKPITTDILSSPHLRRPIDRVATRVTLPGVNYTPGGRMMLTVPPMPSAETPPQANRPLWKRSMVRMIFGRLTVVRYLGDKVDKEGHSVKSRWLVRCQCGGFEVRLGKSLRALNNATDPFFAQCAECQNMDNLRGKKPPDGWQNAPIDTAPLPVGANDTFPDGEKFGRLTVVGYGCSGSRGAKWVVRCDCGAYGLMSSRAIKRGSQQCNGCYERSLP